MDTKEKFLVAGAIVAATAIGAFIYEKTMERSLRKLKEQLDRQSGDRQRAYEQLIQRLREQRANAQKMRANDGLDEALESFYQTYPDLRPKE